MSYEDFRIYLERVKSNKNNDVRIHWPVIDIDNIEAYDQPIRYGLQIADLIVSSINAALEPDYYGNVEERFTRILRRHIYNRHGNYLSYGAKLVPALDELMDAPHAQAFASLLEGE